MLALSFGPLAADRLRDRSSTAKCPEILSQIRKVTISSEPSPKLKLHLVYTLTPP